MLVSKAASALINSFMEGNLSPRGHLFDYYYYLLGDGAAFFPTLTDYGKLIVKKQPAPPALLWLVFLRGVGCTARLFTSACKTSGVPEQSTQHPPCKHRGLKNPPQS